MSEVLASGTSSGIWSRASRRGGPSGSPALARQLADGKLGREQLELFAVQFFLQVREFPRAVSAMHANCPFPKERMALAESVYEEETGRTPAATSPTRSFSSASARPSAKRAGDWSRAAPSSDSRADRLVRAVDRSSAPSSRAAAINLAAEGQVPGVFGPMARRLQENYGLSREAVEFWDIHEMADAEHSDVGDHIVVHHATDAATQARVRDALQHSLDAWWQFFDGIKAAI